MLMNVTIDCVPTVQRSLYKEEKSHNKKIMRDMLGLDSINTAKKG
jgi:hypothetical protein